MESVSGAGRSEKEFGPLMATGTVVDGGGDTELERVAKTDPLWTQDSAYERDGDDTGRCPPSTVTEGDERTRQLFTQDSARSRKNCGNVVLCTPEIEAQVEFASPAETPAEATHPSVGCVVAVLTVVASLYGTVVRLASQLVNLRVGTSLQRAASSRDLAGVSEEDLVCLCQVLNQAKGVHPNERSRHQRISSTSLDATSPLHPRFQHRANDFVSKAVEAMGEEGTERFLMGCASIVADHRVKGKREGNPPPPQATTGLDEMLAACPNLQKEFRLLVLSASTKKFEGEIIRASGQDGSNWNNAFASPIGLEYIERIEQIREEMDRIGLRITSFGDSVAWLASKTRARHFPVFTYFYGGISLILFSFMAGAYPTYEYVDGLNNNNNENRFFGKHTRGSPEDMLGWISLSQKQSFPFEYLLAWGGRYGPSVLSGDWWRWFSSPFVHQNFQHVMSNALLLASLCGYIEHVYGTWRTTVVFFITSLAGNFMSASFEDPCVLVVGASGAVFGFMGFFIADSVKNFESINRPMLRLTIVIGFALFFLFTVFGSQKESYVSHYSHVGGLLCGLMASFLIIPNLKQQDWHIAQAVARRLDVECSQIGTPKANKSRNQFKLDIWEEMNNV